MRAKLVNHAWEYKWSSASAHTGAGDPSGLLNLASWRIPPGDWQDLLQRPEDARDLAAVRSHTHRGRPLATDSFLSKLESSLGRRLRPLPVGRPAKKGKDRRI